MIFDDDDQWYSGMNGAYVFPTFVLQFRENSGKNPQPGKLTRLGIESGSARWEATMLPLDHSDGRQIQTNNIFMQYNLKYRQEKDLSL